MRDSAKGEACTFNIVRVCNFDDTTTVLCHLPDESAGARRKSDDISAAYGCARCHDVIDGRTPHNWRPGEIERYMRRAMVRTWRRMLEKGVIVIKGVKV